MSSEQRWYLVVSAIAGIVSLVFAFVTVALYAAETDDLRRRCICPVEATDYEIRD